MDEILRVYDKPMCCSTGVCGTDVDPVLARFAADVEWLQHQGVTVARYNLAHEPGAFTSCQPVLRAIQERGRGCLPMVLWGADIVASGAYPDRASLLRAVGLAPSEA